MVYSNPSVSAAGAAECRVIGYYTKNKGSAGFTNLAMISLDYFEAVLPTMPIVQAKNN